MRLRTILAVGGAVMTAAVKARQVLRKLREMDLHDKVVLIMGGSRGLALEMARVFKAEGAIVVLAARDKEELARAEKILDMPSKKFLSLDCDVTDKEQVQSTINEVQKRFGKIDVLVNNAGLIEVGPIEVQTLQDFETSIATQFYGPLYAIQAVMPAMQARRSGRIVNISSIAGIVSVPHLVPYSASKHALKGLSDGLRSELIKDNVYVTTVCPGLMRTGSPLNADMKGRHRIEYALFALLDALPITSIDAAQAARQIVDATKHGDARLIISMQARAITYLSAAFPGFVQDMLGLSTWLLPKVGGVGNKSVKGWQSESPITKSFLTKMSTDAAKRNNELLQEQKSEGA